MWRGSLLDGPKVESLPEEVTVEGSPEGGAVWLPSSPHPAANLSLMSQHHQLLSGFLTFQWTFF